MIKEYSGYKEDGFETVGQEDFLEPVDQEYSETVGQ